LNSAKGRVLEEYRQWRRRSGYSDVVEFAGSFEPRYLFEVTSNEIESAKRRSWHAHGDVRGKDSFQ
jgi:hypothetical protein